MSAKSHDHIKNKSVGITGIGIVSAIGNHAKECLQSLRTGKSGLAPVKHLQTVHKDQFIVGEVKLTNDRILEYLEIDKKAALDYIRTSLLGIMAAKEAIHQSNIQLDDGKKTGLVSATTVGGMDITEIEYAKPDTGYTYLATHPCGDSTNKICSYLGIKGYRTTISTACSSGINAIIHAVNLLNHGIIDRAIVGGTDSLSKFTLNGFNSLMIVDKDYCKPFDENRKGLNLGEGAGFLVIEPEDELKREGREAICTISGFANANDAFHQTASSPEGNGAYTSMKDAIEMSGLDIKDIDYINAHGTGTPNNDLSEGTALKRVFGENMPKFSSTKGFTGHTLGAAASIESVFSVLAVQNGIIFPNLNFSEPISEIGLNPHQVVEKANVRNVLSNSFGFGGNNSSIIFSRQ